MTTGAEIEAMWSGAEEARNKLSHLVVRCTELCVITLILEIKNPRLREVGKLPQGPKAG